MQRLSNRVLFIQTVPLIESNSITRNEDDGIAVLIVRLLNEIENNFTLDYSTAEVQGGAEGKGNSADTT